MTDSELRELEIAVARAMGWTATVGTMPVNRGTLPMYIFDRNGEYQNDVTGVTSEVAAWDIVCPKFARDPAATAEVRERLTRNGAQLILDYQTVDAGEFVNTTVFSADPEDKLQADIYEWTHDHDDDFKRTEGIAICRAFLAAHEATQQTAQTPAKRLEIASAEAPGEAVEGRG